MRRQCKYWSITIVTFCKGSDRLFFAYMQILKVRVVLLTLCAFLDILYYLLFVLSVFSFHFGIGMVQLFNWSEMCCHWQQFYSPLVRQQIFNLSFLFCLFVLFWLLWFYLIIYSDLPITESGKHARQRVGCDYSIQILNKISIKWQYSLAQPRCIEENIGGDSSMILNGWFISLTNL